MIAEMLFADGTENDEAVSAALTAQHRLSDDDLQRIREAMEAASCSFAEAAVRTAVITEKELRDTLAWLRRAQNQQDGSIVESALRRRTNLRQLTPHYKHQVRASTELALAHDPQGSRSEQVRSLRTELLLLLHNSNSRAIALALLSPGPGEGRSLLAADLAIAFSQLNRQTLLVDADLRRPRQHVLFGADNGWGLGQALAFREPPQYLGVEGLPNLSLLTSGPLVPNPLELISDGGLERVMSVWKNTFDFIVFDTPPVAEYADGLAIAALAQQSLILSRAEKTIHQGMKEMLRRLTSTQARIVGAVLNRF